MYLRCSWVAILFTGANELFIHGSNISDIELLTVQESYSLSARVLLLLLLHRLLTVKQTDELKCLLEFCSKYLFVIIKGNLSKQFCCV